MFKLLRFLKGKAILCAIIAPIMMFLEVSMDLFQPTLMANIIDIGIVNNDKEYIFSTGIKMIIAAVIGIFGGITCSVFASISGIKFAETIRKELFNKIQTLSSKEIDSLKTSSLITRLTNDIMQIQNMFITSLKMMVRAPFLCIGSLIMSFILSPKLAILFLISLPLIIISIILVMKKSLPLFLIAQEKIDNINLVMRENILGVRVIKIFCLVKKQLNKFYKSNNELKDSNINAQNMNMSLWPIIGTIMNFTVVGVLWFGGIMYSNNTIKIGVIMAFINYTIQTMNSLVMSVNLAINFSRAKVSADRINEVFDMTNSIKNNSIKKEIKNYSIEFKNVYFKYNKNSAYVLKNINFKINPGEKIGIIGNTGSGKSTLVQLICRLYDVTKGEILIGNSNLKDYDLDILKEHISLITQQNTVLSGTIEDNIKFGNTKADENLIIQSAKDASAYDFILQKENGFKSNIEQRGQNLSGGQKQRLCIARTLVRKNKIFIMDDSTSALDTTTESKLHKNLKKRLKNSTMIIITQKIFSIMNSDKIIVLDNGQISDIGNHKYLLKKNELYRSIAISQMGEEVKKIG